MNAARLIIVFRIALLALPALCCGVAMAGSNPGWLAVAHALDPHGSMADFTPHGTQPGLSNSLLESNTCRNCHGPGGASPPSATSYLPFSSWGGSMMANATRDPIFWAALDIANHDQAGVGDYCLRCHTPRGWYAGHVVKPGFNPPNDPTLGAAGCLLSGSYDEQDDLNNDFSGETCHFCHRLMPSGPMGQAGYIGNANAWLDDESCANTGGGPCRRGPYDYSGGGNTPPHEWVYSQYHTDSAICGLCHNVSSPDTSTAGDPLKTLVLNNGTDTGHPFPVERTFSEWQQSDYSAAGGQTCQSCHMPVSEDPNATACSLPGYPNRTGNLPVHQFVGGNTWVPGIIAGEFNDTSQIPGSNGGVDRAASYAQTIDWARQMLQSSAAVDTTITAYAPPTSGAAGSLTAAVKITNLSGHKLPTGYAEGRRMWLNLQVRDADGALVFESAAYDPDTAVLTEDAQARVFEVLQGIYDSSGGCVVDDTGGAAMFHFVLNDCIAKDNRIPPLGFQPATTDDPQGYDLRPIPVGSYAETSPGSGILVNYASADYHVDVPAGTPTPLSVSARLYYQTSSREYMEFLRDQAADNGFPGENAMCSAAPNRPFVVGPQERSRGQYAYDLWSSDDEIFGQGFDNATAQRSYGKSPPELMQVDDALTAN